MQFMEARNNKCEVRGVWLLTGPNKKPHPEGMGFKEYGSYLLSRIVVQYHRP